MVPLPDAAEKTLKRVKKRKISEVSLTIGRKIMLLKTATEESEKFKTELKM